MHAESRKLPGKRQFDVVVASIVLIMSSPVTALSALAVRLTSSGPVLHRAERVGLGGASFTMFKFRSMYVADDPKHPGGDSPTTGLNDPRVTAVGNFLRRYKLDELPQLINVLRGEMSLVGPRPEVRECVDLYSPELMQILTVRPGLTDLASLQFIDLQATVGASDNPHAAYLDLVFDEKNRLRLEYVQRASWRLDLKILLFTFLKIVGVKIERV